MFGQKNWLVILVTRGSLEIFGEGDSAVQSLPLPATIVDNLEVLNKDALYTLITDWTKQKTYRDTEITWVLSPEICFTQVISSTDQDNIDSETLQFLDTVPFEEIVSRIYSTTTGRLLVATNQALINALIQGFSLHGYTTHSVVPGQILGIESGLTPELIGLTRKKAGELKRESLLVPVLAEPKMSPQVLAVGTSVQKPKSQLPLLLTIFLVLLAILGFVLYLNQ